MWRYGAGVLSALLLAGGGVILFRGTAQTEAPLPQPKAAPVGMAPLPPAPVTIPSATERTREQKRFDRYDKDRDGSITRDEYLASRRKAYAKLDRDGDGRLSFEEWAVRAATKFAGADRDKSGAMNAAEFATTAVKRRPARRCPPAQAQAEEG